MANIIDELNDILQAIRGEEVRQSIYRGLVGVNLQTERLEDVVGALNDAITAETSTNVQSFVEKVSNAVWYQDGDTVTFGEDCGNDFFMIPGVVSEGSASDRLLLSFTVTLPKAFKPSTNGYSVDVSNLTLGSLHQLYNGSYMDTSTISVLENGVLQNGILQCVALNDLNTDKLHVLIVVPTMADILIGIGPVFVSVSKLDFTITENATT